MAYSPASTSLCQRIIISRRRRQQQRQLQCNPIIDIPSNVARRRSPKHKIKYMNHDGIWEILIPRRTFWCMFYLQSPRLGDKYYETKFRNRFRLPYNVFKEILADIMINPLFKRWHHKRVDTPVVLGLLLLGALRYLGRGWTFDDLEESTAISLYVHRDFFHIFIKYGRENLYPRYVKYPSIATEMKIHSK